MTGVLLGIGIWLSTSALFGVAYGVSWWRYETARDRRRQRAADLAHFKRELAGLEKPYKAMGGGCW